MRFLITMGSANLIGSTRIIMEQYAATLAPVMILGEIGTGKTKAASFLLLSQ